MTYRNFILMTDIDGTLISEGQRIIDSTVAKLMSYLAKNNQLIINSARHVKGVQFLLQEWMRFVPTIALNGAALYSESWNSPSQLRTFDTESLRVINTLGQRYDLSLLLYGKEDCWTTSTDIRVEMETNATGMAPKRLLTQVPNPIAKVTAIGEETELDSFATAVERSMLASISKSNPCYLEISPPGITKATLIPELLSAMGIQRNQLELFYFGDSLNDIEAATYADQFFTFSHSPAPLLKIAKKSFTVRSSTDLAHAIDDILARRHRIEPSGHNTPKGNS